MRITRAPRATLHLSKSIQQSRQNVSRVCHQTVRLLDRLEKSENNRKRFSRRTRPELVSPSRFLSTAVGAEAMAASFGVPFLGRVPLDPSITRACEAGASYTAESRRSGRHSLLATIVDKLIASAPQDGPEPVD